MAPSNHAPDDACPTCSDTRRATYATTPRRYKQPGQTGNLTRIGSWCWNCQAFEPAVIA